MPSKLVDSERLFRELEAADSVCTLCAKILLHVSSAEVVNEGC